MLTPIQTKLLNLNLTQFPLMAAAAASIKDCPVCPHKKANKKTILRAAALRMQNNAGFKSFLKEHFGLPVMIGGVLFKEQQ